MDKLENYRQIIKRILREDATYKPAHGEIDPLLVFDEEHDSYQLMYVGWDGTRRMHSSIIHIRIQNGKIWIEYDGTEEGVANALLQAGIPREEIVLSFYSPRKRKHTEFAVV